MFNSVKLTLYTQEDCGYCKLLKKKLSEWNFDYREINISHDLFAKDFLKDYYMNKRNNRKAYESVMDSYRNMIVEKKEMNPKVIEKIAKLTDRNDHNESLLLLAKELKDREAVKLLGNIKDMHPNSANFSLKKKTKV